MKVVDLETRILRSYEYPQGGWVLVRLQTEAGVQAVGECFVPDAYGGGVGAVKNVIDYNIKPLVLEQDVLDVTLLWERMYRGCCDLYDRRGLAIHAISGVDMALYDAAARTLAIPVHKLLGGCFRDRVRVYVSSIWIDPRQPEPAWEATADYVAQGFTAIKYWGWSDFGADLKRDARLLLDLRQAAGEGVDLMLDLGRPYSAAQAVRIARMIEETGMGIYWWEEPLSSTDDVEGLATLTASTDLTIAAGEAEMTAFPFRDLILARAVDVLQPDLSWVGGLTEGKRIAELARLFKVRLVPHNWGTIVNFAASIHLVAAMPDGFLCEYPITPRTREAELTRTPSPMMTELAKSSIKIEDGHAIVPREAGLGIELDPGIVDKYAIE